MILKFDKYKTFQNRNKFNKFILLIFFSLGFLIFGNIFEVQASASPTYASTPTASEVLVVYNSAWTEDSNSNGKQDSQELAEYYKLKRSGVHLTSVSTVTTETISRTDYNSQIRDILETYLTNNNLRSVIKFIVLVRGMPLRITYTNSTAYGETDYSSVGAALCLLYNDGYNINWRLNNPYYNIDQYYTKAFHFETNHFIDDYSNVTLNYLVTRLDGLTLDDVKTMIDKGANVDTSRTAYWLIDDENKTYDSMSTAFDKLNDLNLNLIPNPWEDTYYSYLRILDVSNISNIVLKSNFTLNEVQDIYVSGNYAYVADSHQGLKILNISNPSSPSLVGSFNNSADTNGDSDGVFVSGNYAYVVNADAGLQAIDISDPTTPSLSDTYDTTGQAVKVFVSGNYAYIADGESGLQIIDISNPSSLSFVANYNLDESLDVFVSGNYAYVADGDDGLQIIDISTPSSPTSVSTYINLSANSNGVFVVNDKVYMISSSYITTNSHSLIGYTSHGIHAGSGYYLHTGMGDGWVSDYPINPNHLNLNLANGAVYSTYESYNGRYFRSKTGTRHGLVTEWIEIGGSGGIGNVEEPWSSTIAQEKIWMPEYAIGYTWAEAAYMSLRYMDFVSTVVGDPLMVISEITAPSPVSSVVTSVGNNQVSLSWTNPGDADFAGVKVLRKTDSYPGHSADGTLIYNGTNESYVDTDVVNATTYYYAIFAYDEVPNYSNLASDSKASATPSSDTTPPDSVTGLSAISGNHQVILNWTNPTNADFVGVRVLRKESSYSNNYNDGVPIYNGSSNSYVDTGLNNNTTYYYTIFAYDAGPNYSVPGSGAKITATPYLIQSGMEIDVSPPGLVYNFSATPANGQVSLAWTNPSDSDLALIRVLRRTDYYPQTFSDGVLVSSSYTTTYIDRDVTNNTTYFYTAFACDRSLNCSLASSNSRAYATPCSGTCSDASPETAPSYSSSDPDFTPPNSITNFTATPGNASVNLSWTNPFDDDDWAGTAIVRKTSSYPNSYSDGILLYKGQDGGIYTDTNVVNGTTYYYGAFAYDSAGNYTASSTDASASATPSS